MSRLTLLVCVALITFRVAASASAEEQRSEAERLFEQAQAHLAHGDFDLAVEFFERSFLLSAAPVLVYDMAQAYRLKGDCEAALRQYRRFLRLSDGLPPADTIDEPRRLARERIAELGRQCGQPGQTEDAAFEKPAVAPRPEPRAAVESEGAKAMPTPDGEGKQSPGRRAYVLPLVLAVVGGAALTTGIYYVAVDGREQCATGESSPCAFRRDTAGFGWSSLVGGAVLLASAVTVAVLELRTSTPVAIGIGPGSLRIGTVF